MLRLLVLTSLLVCCLAAPRVMRPRNYGRVVGGEDADIKNYPYQVSFEYYGSHQCGGSIISENWVVTAAHCADGVSASNVAIRVGSSLLEEGGSLHEAAQVIVHADFDYYNIDYDIAVIQVKTAFVLGDSVQPIALASKEPAAGTASVVTGWGATYEGAWELPSQLQQVSVPIVDRVQCNDAYSSYGGVTERMICAGMPEGGKDACQGDSGGPLAAGGELVGVVSWGAGCARPKLPGVYTNVANLRAWVKTQTDV